jgi:cystathionine beta-lyase
MGIADMDFRAAPCITEALAERCKHENWGYLSDTNSYVEAIAAWNSERHGIEVDPGSISVADGVHPGLIATLTAVSPPGTKVLMNTPTYNGFYGDLRWTRTLVNDSEMYLDSDGVYHIDWDDFEARMTPDCHAMLLCNPQNPTGNMWSEEDLLRIGELCLKHGVTVLADEIHCDFVMKGQKYTPFASLPDKAIVNNSLTFKAVSKTFSLAAMKSAYFFSTNPVLLERVRWHHRPNTNTLGVVANEAAYRNGAEWFDQLLPYIDENHSFVEAYIKERIPLIKYKKAQGTYLAWLDVTDLAAAIDAEKNAAKEQLDTPEYYVEKWVVENARVHLQPGSWHGTGGANHMRMNLGAPRPLLEKALDNIAEAAKNV